MLAPKWLHIVAYVAVFNAVWVAVSLVHRHLWADDRAGSKAQAAPLAGAVLQSRATAAEEETSTARKKTAELTLQEKLEQLEPPVLQSSTQPIAEDDPLMAEIRKQMAEKFPDLDVSTNEGLKIPSEANKPEVTTPATLTIPELQARFAAVGQLSSAAQSLIQLSGDLRAAGKVDQANKIDLHVQQLQTFIREMLQ
jgi:response regulator RpfG family c-di-GMP phosphodiesterase